MSKCDRHRRADATANSPGRQTRSGGRNSGLDGAQASGHTPGVPDARFLRLDAVAPFALAAGVRARALFGDDAMLNLVELDPGAIVPEHSHPHEQLGIGLRGLITMVVGGEEHPLGPMDAMHIPSGVVHKGVAGPEGALVLDVFTPIREDFRALADSAAAE
jgi:quercetin dioxygenase-like cupin family protein